MSGRPRRTPSSTSAAARIALDERQRQAVEAEAGPLLILAGAGSGKTRVLTERAAAFASGDLSPEAVLVITFTNRAADELRERLCVLVGERPALRMTIGTFHAVCHRMVRRHARRAGRTPAFSVYDQSASRRLVRRALADVGLAALTPALAALQIGQAKARLLSPTDYRALRDSDQVRAIATAWERYEHYLAQSDALDFDDLMGRAVVLLGAPDLAARYRQRWRAVLIDEYQDTNPAQYEWVKRLVQDHQRDARRETPRPRPCRARRARPPRDPSSGPAARAPSASHAPCPACSRAPTAGRDSPRQAGPDTPASREYPTSHRLLSEREAPTIEVVSRDARGLCRQTQAPAAQEVAVSGRFLLATRRTSA
ncbi:MAG: UvrD-helicase domain-containing protein [Thermoleophilaceae bacterium]|nr:UvrD-helicase domain-containing protein [Thermoleophilaceae bacterium]